MALLSLHELLKNETRDLHLRAERAFARFELSQAEGYGEFLQAQAAALLPLEAALDRQHAASLLDDWSERRRGDALCADLAALGLAAPPLQPEPRFASAEQVLGALYVLEGSKLGARYLLARVVGPGLARGDSRIARAVAFLSFDTDPARAGMWPAFLARLDTILPGSAGAADALSGAQTAFAFFERAATRFEKA